MHQIKSKKKTTSYQDKFIRYLNIKNKRNKAKLASNANTENKKTMNSDKASITKVIPSINVNVN